MIEELRKLEDKGLITLRAHDELPLWIANYTPDVQYDRLWDEHELLTQCRGLIVDENGNVVARPFEKFFNYGEHLEFDSLPDIPTDEYFEVYEKLDGSLGIIFWYKGKWRVATRGSFHSEQAQKGRELLQNYETEKMNKDYTYLVEVIYPENRIVVNYGDKEELVLIAKIRTSDGAEPIELNSLHESNVFPIARKYPSLSPEELKDKFSDKDGEDMEGFVLHYESGLRIKIKLEDYVKLHRVLTGLTKRKVWELLKDGEDVKQLYKIAPDEVYDWIEETVEELTTKYVWYKKVSEIAYRNLKKSVEAGEGEFSRKEFALKVKNNPTVQELGIQSIMFSKLDGEDVSDKIWKLIYPEHETYSDSQN